jgi:hypothetical protein
VQEGDDAAFQLFRDQQIDQARGQASACEVGVRADGADLFIAYLRWSVAFPETGDLND